MMLKWLGAAREVGRSGIFLGSKAGNVIMDYGVKVGNVKGSQPDFPLKVEQVVDGVLVSHSHLDHCGMVPSFFSRGLDGYAYATPLTFQIMKLLVEDSLKIARLEGYKYPFSNRDIDRMRRKEFPVHYRKQIEIQDLKVRMFDAGHIPGAAAIYIDTGEKTVLYTGDLKVDSTELVNPADLDLPEVDILITESTYSDRDHPDRRKAEKLFIESIKETLENNGTVLLPAFAIGRSQELLLILEKYGLHERIFLDGMGKKVLDAYLSFPGFIKDPKRLNKIASHLNWVHGQKERQEVLKQPSIIITSAGMLEGGPVRYYMDRLYNNPKAKVILSGFQVEDTAGHLLREKQQYVLEGTAQKVHAAIEYFDFSAHAGRTELWRYIKNLNPKQIFTMHGEKCKEFAEELQMAGFAAAAPELGETFRL